MVIHRFVFASLLVMGMPLHAVWADATGELFFRASGHYAEGRYDQARDGYEELLGLGVESRNLFYNLGNTYFKLGEKGRAILNYERAKKIGPPDEDLLANANFVVSLLEARQPEENRGWAARFLRGIRDLFPPAGWFLVLWVVYLSWIASLGVALLRRESQRPIILCVGLGLVVILSYMSFRASAGFHGDFRPGVVIGEKVKVRYSPSFDGSVAFELHEGLKAEVLRQEGDWTQIRLGPLKSGWVGSSSIEEI